MAKEIKNDKLKAKIVLPEPLTVKHWAAYEQPVEGLNNQGTLVAAFLKALRVVESAQCEGFPDLKSAGDSAPLDVAVWVGNEVSRAFLSKFPIEGN